MPQTITNIPRCLPQILTIPKFWYHLAHSFSQKTKLKKWHQNSWHWQKSSQSSKIFVTSRGICRGVGVSSRKGEHFSILDKNGAHKNKACLTYICWNAFCVSILWHQRLFVQKSGVDVQTGFIAYFWRKGLGIEPSAAAAWQAAVSLMYRGANQGFFQGTNVTSQSFL